MPSVIAIDWSGRETGAAESIWLAHVVDGELVRLANGSGRRAVIAHALELAGDHQQTVIGLDFAFSFPCWYVEERGWSSGREVWAAMRDEAEDLLRGCEPPFWGRAGRRRPADVEMHRRTEMALPFQPKSVFQIGGAGAVGTGSLRGMEHLATLAEAGCSIWPFDPAGWPRVVEIYPRLLTGKVHKSRHRERLGHLEEHFATLPEPWRERAAGSEDAFDAAVSALRMADGTDALVCLERADEDSPELLEGEIWIPPA